MTYNARTSGNSGEKILIVEDSPTQAEKLCYMLEKNSYRVAVARNGKEALAMMSIAQPSLIISDVVMPEMDGYELCRRIKSHDEICNIRIILLTSLCDPLDVIRGLECGADNFITKPYDEAYLVSRIGYLLENRYEPQDCASLPGLKILFEGKEFAISSSRHQILDLLLSTYETAMQKNRELTNMRDEQKELNEQLKAANQALNRVHDELEKRVEKRTEELAATVEILRKETSEKLLAMEELREKEQMFVQQSRLAALGEMINNIAHQWRQPLNVLGLVIQQMKLYYEIGSFSKEYLDTSVKKSMGLINHMSQTIDDFRNFFKPDKEMVEFRVHEVVARTVSLVEDGFKNHRIRVDFHANANPAIIGFPNEYSQVLLNILMNARDALLDRKPDNARITVTISTEGEKGVVTIADNAGGIAADAIGKIFEPYFTTKGPDKGTGVGLFMSKTIIEKNMNGKLTARNTGEGAEFRIEV
jgi:signal transduction histidine kinase